METSHLRLRMHIPPELQEILIGELAEAGFSGFEQDEGILEAWIPSDRFTPDIDNHVRKWIARYPETCRIETQEVLQDRNWNEEWEQTIQPQTIGRFYIHPTWSADNVPADTIPVAIDPKMSFGTGYHETTRLVLRLLPDFVRLDGNVLDMGTGTGILAIAALKLGAGSAVGIDIDSWSYENALENAVRNDVGGRLDVRVGTAANIGENERFDLILANINLNVLLEMGETLSRLVVDSGYLLLSGILVDDEKTILNSTAYGSLNHIKTIRENEWLAMAFQQKQDS